MATRTAKLYQGEDMTPVLDYTDQVIWEESEFGTRAWMGEGNASTVVIRDPLGEQGNEASLPAGLTAKSLASKNLFVIQLGTDYMFRGRVGIKNYGRDSQHVERYRQVECSLHDTNWDLDHIFVHDYVRPAEDDIQRAQGVIASYLSGFPRESTALNGSNFLSGSNTVSLPENTYTQTSPLGVLREIAVTANKQFFVTGDSLLGGSLFWDGWDSTAYQAGIRISDRPDEVNTEGSCSASTQATIVDYGFISGATNITVLGTPGIPAGLVDSALYIFNPERHDDIHSGGDEWGGGALTGTYGATAMELLAAVRHPVSDSGFAGAGASSIGVFRILSPASGIHTVSTLNAIPAERNVKVWVLLENVSQTSPESEVGTNTGTGATSSVSVSGGGRLVLDMAAKYQNTVDTPHPTPGAGQTPIHASSDTGRAWGSSYGSASPTHTFPDAGTKWAAAAVAVNASVSEDAPTFPPIWNVGPSSTEDGSEQLCEVRLFWGSGTDQYVTAHSLVTHTLYGHSSETFTDDTIATEAEAQTKANSILGHRRFEDKTYNVTIGPLTDEQVLCVRHGQLIQIKARAIPDADDTFRTMRIAQCRYTTPIVGIWFAHLQLGRPWKMEPYSKGPPLAPKAAGSGSTPEPLGLTGDPGTDTGTFANDDHSHAHGTFGTNDLHTEYVREPILTTAGDMPYASGASVWTRLALGASNFHMVSDGLTPLWRPQAASGSGSPLTVQDEGTPLATDATTLNFVGAGVVASGAGATKTITIPGGGVSSPFWWHADNAPGGANDREFNEGTVIGTLTRVSHGTPKGTWAEVNDGLEWTHTVSAVTELDVFAIPLTISVGDYVTLAASFPGYTPSALGSTVGFSNGTTFGTSNALAATTHLTGATYRHLFNSWPGHNSLGTNSTFHDVGLADTVYGWRVKYEAANTWGFYVRSPGTGVWRAIQTNYAYTMTPTHVIFGIQAFNSPAFSAANGVGVRLECFRMND